MATLPDTLYTWAWTPTFVEQMQNLEARSNLSGLILPDSMMRNIEKPEAHIAHFARLERGGERDWLWLFRDVSQAIALRLLPRYAPPEKHPDTELIRSTLPPDIEGQAPMSYIQLMPLDWLKRWRQEELEGMGFVEVWLGFDYRAFARDYRLRSSTEQIFSLDEWYELLKR